MSRSVRRSSAPARILAVSPSILAAATGLSVTFGSPAVRATDYAWLAAASGNFSDPARWTPTGAPTMAEDTAAIDLGGIYTVTVNTDLSITGITMNALEATLFAQSRTIELSGGLSLMSGTIDSRSSTWGGAGSIDITGGTFLARGSTTFATGGSNAGLLWVNGATGPDHATLFLQDGFMNTGTLRMQSSNTTWASNLNISGGTLHNMADGLFEVNQGTGGNRLFTGSLTNDGTVTVEASRILSISDAGAFTVRHQGGLIDAQGEMRLNGGAFEWAGGDISGTVRVDDGTIDVDSTAGTGTIIAGGLTALVDNSRTAATVWVQGSNASDHTTLGLAGDAENRGTIRMESINTTWSSNINTGAFTLTNRASGTIEVNQGTGGARTFAGSLVNRGEIVTNTFLTLNATNYTTDGGDIGALHGFRGSTISIADTTAGGTTLHLEGANTLLTDNLDGVTLWVRGVSGPGNATLTIGDGAANHGTIRMESLNTSWDETLDVSGGTLHNSATGAIIVNLGTNGDRDLVGSLVNDGTVFVEASELLSISDVGAYSVTHQGGLLDAMGEIRLLAGGAFDWTGGVINGTVRVVNGTIDIAESAGAGTVIAGGSTQLFDNLSTTSTVWVQGSGISSNALLGLAGDASNHGVIRMESITTSWHSNIDTGAFTLTNETGGLIEVNKGTNGDRRILGTIVNRGDIVVGEDEFLELTADYTADAGHILGDHAFSGLSTLRTTTSPALRGDLSTLVLTGGSISFDGDLLSGYELWVRGGSFGGAALTTMATDGAANRGVIRLETLNSTWQSSLSLAGDYTNSTSGLIQALNGSGGERNISGDTYTFTNRGEVFVEAGETLTFSSTNGFTLRQAQGEINADGLLDVVNGLFRLTGGDIDGTVRVSGGSIEIGSGLGGESTVIAAGASTLRDNLSTLGTVWVQGSPARGNAFLTPDNPTLDEVTNLGTIRLETLSSTWHSSIVAGPDTLVNGATGVIDVREGTGGDRRVHGGLRNEGLITVEEGALLDLNTVQYDAAGGEIAGNHAFTGASTISFTADAQTPHTLVIASGGNTILTDITAGHEVWSRGISGFGAATVNFAADTSNHGTVRLQTASSTWGSNAAVAGNARWTNADDGVLLVAAGTGGARTLSLLLENAGAATFETGATLAGNAELGSVINSGTWQMTSTATVAANSSSAKADTTFENSGFLGGVGTLSLDGGDGLLINSGEISPGLSAGTLNLNGSFEQTSTGALTIELEGPLSGQGDRMTITRNATLDGAVNVSLLGEYVPDWGDRWSILTYDSATGDLDVIAPSLDDPLLRWWSEATEDSFDIGVRHVADINHDDFIDFDDLNLVLSFFNTIGDGLPGDANEDGAVDFGDLNLVVSYFNTQAPPNVPAPGAAFMALAGLAAAAGRRTRVKA